MAPLSAAQPISLPGAGFALLSAASFALQGLFARLAYTAGANAPTVGFGRFALTGLVLWAYAFWRGREGAFPLRLDARTTTALLVLGSVGYFLGSLTYLAAVTTIPVSLAGLLLYTYPAVATMITIHFGRERLSRGLAVGLVLATWSFVPTIGTHGWGSIAGMAVVSTIVAAGGFLAALRRLGPSRAATISTVESPLTVLFAALILGERLAAPQLAGGLVILLGVLVVIRERREDVRYQMSNVRGPDI